MRKPNYSVAHERENQRRRVLEEEEERERERDRLRRAIAEEKEEIRRKRELMNDRPPLYNYNPVTHDLFSNEIPKPTATAGEATNENIMVKMFEKILAGPPPTIRVIARFGQSNYDITITKPEELEAIQAIINKFINAFQPTSNNFNSTF